MGKDRIEINDDGKVISRHQGSKKYYGLASIILLVATGFMFKSAMDTFAKTISCLFSGNNNLHSIQDSYLLGAGGFIALILALACAGASLATGSQSVLGALTLGIVLLPFILFLLNILFGLEMDLSLFSSIPSPSPNSNAIACR